VRRVAALIVGLGLVPALVSGPAAATVPAAPKPFTNYCDFAATVESTNRAASDPTLFNSPKRFEKAWKALRAVDGRIPKHLPAAVRAAWKVVLATDAELTTIYARHHFDADAALKDPDFADVFGPRERRALRRIARYHRSTCGIEIGRASCRERV